MALTHFPKIFINHNDYLISTVLPHIFSSSISDLASTEISFPECQIIVLSEPTPLLANQSTTGFASLNACVTWTFSNFASVSRVSSIMLAIDHEGGEIPLILLIMFLESPSNQRLEIPTSKASLTTLHVALASAKWLDWIPSGREKAATPSPKLFLIIPPLPEGPGFPLEVPSKFSIDHPSEGRSHLASYFLRFLSFYFTIFLSPISNSPSFTWMFSFMFFKIFLPRIRVSSSLSLKILLFLSFQISQQK